MVFQNVPLYFFQFRKARNAKVVFFVDCERTVLFSVKRVRDLYHPSLYSEKKITPGCVECQGLTAGAKILIFCVGHNIFSNFF